ncbi:MAG: alkaline phosphatase D family protein [Fuerstiella sp.]
MPRHHFLIAISLLSLCASAADSCAAELSAGQGIMVGEVTASSANIQVRLTHGTKLIDRDLAGATGVVRFSLQPTTVPRVTLIKTVPATAGGDFIARASFSGLYPGTKYICRTKIGKSKAQLTDGPRSTFSTLPGKTASTAIKFVVVTGMNYAKFHGDDRIDRKQHLLENNTDLPRPYTGPDKHLGYPSLASILKLQPDFFVGTGDNVYYDTPDKPRAESIPELRQKWHEQFVQPRYRDLFAAVPTYWMIDDHDYRIDDGDNSGDYKPTPAEGRRVMLEQLPIAAADNANAKTYRTHRTSRDLQIWFPENRMYRSDNATPDGPKKTIWGTEQKAWLKSTLAASDAKFKLLISPTPMIGPDDLRKTDNHCDIGGFRHERDEFFAWLKKSNIENFYIICGDRHWQYHSIAPSGFEEFSCGALVDANSRLGRKPGDPKSTDVDATIKQPYYQTPRSGGFLMVHSTGTGTLRFVWHNELGVVLHQHEKK